VWYKLICTVSVVLMFGFAISATLEDSSGFTAFTVLCAVCFLALLGVIYYAHRGSPYGQEWENKLPWCRWLLCRSRCVCLSAR
jgi:hypothetical protein